MSTAPILLEAIGVEKRYDKFAALAGVDLKVRANTVHSVIGPNGAGKTTLFHMLTGTKAVSGGRIVFDGHDVTREPDHRRVQRGMARSFQVTSLFLTLPVRENLRLAAQGTAPAQALNCWSAPVGARSPRRRGGPRAGPAGAGAPCRHARGQSLARPAAPARGGHGAGRGPEGHLSR